MLRDAQRFARLLERFKINFVFSGKSHPDDRLGKAIVARLVQAGEQYPGRVVFIENYDLSLARTLTRGCDVWLNNPVRPLEASGTSGMKAAMNGVLNLSILDGWWAEACEHGINGWAIGDELTGEDQRDLEALHHVLEHEVLTTWQDRERWLDMMQASIASTQERFSSHRMVRDYFDKLYAFERERAPEPVPATR